MSTGAVGLWTLWAIASLFGSRPGRPRSVSASGGTSQQVRVRLDTAIRGAAPGTTLCLPAEPGASFLGYPGLLGLFVLHYPTDDVEGRRVRFVSSDPKVLALRDRAPGCATLIVPEGACPPSGAKSG